MNVEDGNISDWFESNKVCLNVDDTKWSLFYLPVKRTHFPYNLSNLFTEDLQIKKMKM